MQRLVDAVESSFAKPKKQNWNIMEVKQLQTCAFTALHIRIMLYYTEIRAQRLTTGTCNDRPI